MIDDLDGTSPSDAVGLSGFIVFVSMYTASGMINRTLGCIRGLLLSIFQPNVTRDSCH